MRFTSRARVPVKALRIQEKRLQTVRHCWCDEVDSWQSDVTTWLSYRIEPRKSKPVLGWFASSPDYELATSTIPGTSECFQWVKNEYEWRSGALTGNTVVSTLAVFITLSKASSKSEILLILSDHFLQRTDELSVAIHQTLTSKQNITI